MAIDQQNNESKGSEEFRERARRNNSIPTTPIRANVARAGLAVVSDLVSGFMSKQHLLDLSIRAKDGEPIKTSRFILGARSRVFEEMLFGSEPTNELDLSGFAHLTVCTAMEYVFTNDLSTTNLVKEETQEGIRSLVQLTAFGERYEIAGLPEEASRRARIMMHKQPALVMAAYDESFQGSGVETYALQMVVDDPSSTLFHPDGGVRHLCKCRLEDLLQQSSVPLEEITVFETLKEWSNVHTNNEAFVKECTKYIELRYIEPFELLSVVRESGLFEYNEILEAAADQALLAQMDGKLFSNYRGARHKERAVVTDAGKTDVNGVYEKNKQRWSDGEPIYTKHSERRDGEYGLFFWKRSWHVAPLTDLSNVCYSCQHDDQHCVPHTGWKAAGSGTDPPPQIRVLQAVKYMDIKESIRHSLPACYRSYEDFLGN